MGGGDEPTPPQLIQLATATGVWSLCAEAPVLVAVDDAHWLDPPTAAAVTYLARRMDDQPLGFLVTRRANEPSPAPLGLDGTSARPASVQLWLEPLGMEMLPRLLADRLGMSLSRPHLTRLHQLSGGDLAARGGRGVLGARGLRQL